MRGISSWRNVPVLITPKTRTKTVTRATRALLRMLKAASRPM